LQHNTTELHLAAGSVSDFSKRSSYVCYFLFC